MLTVSQVEYERMLTMLKYQAQLFLKFFARILQIITIIQD